ncbi:alpha-L-fucosidase [Fodinicola acaciae]|uniref:alpha-L-fucosidase n=1 Tax=Fodinicola acaciae TaxID=2681555 RepID=UPI0013D019ED|nr:alpha-L-fucosidase [Fodinicola acaciae]
MTRRGFLGVSAVGIAATAIPSSASTSWYDDAKLGVFIHWNAASIPAFAPLVRPNLASVGDPGSVPRWQQQQLWRALPYAEMYQNTMAVPGSETGRHHQEKYGGLPYDAFVERFRLRSIAAVDPAAWAEQFRLYGAKYAVLTTKTEDGFLLWPSAHANPRKAKWQAGRDIVGELAVAVRQRGLRFGTYYSTGMDWTFGGIPIVDSESLFAAVPRGREYLRYADAHWRELIAKYRPSVLWSDYGFQPYDGLDALFGAYAKTVPDGIVNDRFDVGRQSTGKARADFVTLEYAQTNGPAGRKWEACRGIGYSFGYNRQEDASTYLDARALLHLFVDIVAAGGNLLINVGPTETGEIVARQAVPLLSLGRWLRTNGKAIYGSRPWRRAKGATTDGQDIRYTTAKSSLYATVLGSPPSSTVDIDVRLPVVARVRAMDGRDLRWQQSPQGTRIWLPDGHRDPYATTVELHPATAATDPV